MCLPEVRGDQLPVIGLSWPASRVWVVFLNNLTVSLGKLIWSVFWLSEGHWGLTCWNICKVFVPDLILSHHSRVTIGEPYFARTSCVTFWRKSAASWCSCYETWSVRRTLRNYMTSIETLERCPSIQVIWNSILVVLMATRATMSPTYNCFVIYS